MQLTSNAYANFWSAPMSSSTRSAMVRVQSPTRLVPPKTLERLTREDRAAGQERAGVGLGGGADVAEHAVEAVALVAAEVRLVEGDVVRPVSQLTIRSPTKV